MNTEIKVGDEIVIKGIVDEVDEESGFSLVVKFENMYLPVSHRFIEGVNGREPHDYACRYRLGDEVHMWARVLSVDDCICVELGGNSAALGDNEHRIAYQDIARVNGEEFKLENHSS